ncbi:Uncharacterised protein [Bordetella pertussis]|nr:Uncharacterised protein [Bordetella pertussis]
MPLYLGVAAVLALAGALLSAFLLVSRSGHAPVPGGKPGSAARSMASMKSPGASRPCGLYHCTVRFNPPNR